MISALNNPTRVDMLSNKSRFFFSITLWFLFSRLIFFNLSLLTIYLFLSCFFFHYVSAKFHLWPSSDDLLRPRIGMKSLVTVSPVITAFHSGCLSHHVFDRVNLWPAWVGFETAIFWQCSPGTVETQRPIRCYLLLCFIFFSIYKLRYFMLFY